MRFLDIVALGFIAALALPAAPGSAEAVALPGFDAVAEVMAVADFVGEAGGVLANAVDAGAGTVDHCNVSASCVLLTIERVIVPVHPIEVMIA